MKLPILAVPLPVRLVYDPPLTDDELLELSAGNDVVWIEREASGAFYARPILDTANGARATDIGFALCQWAKRDAGYRGQTETIKKAAPHAQDMTCKRTKFKDGVDELEKKKNKSKSSVRSKVEDVFRIVKRIFGFDKARYRGIAKNHNRLCANFALANLSLHRKRLAVLG